MLLTSQSLPRRACQYSEDSLPWGHRATYILSFNVIVPSKSVKKMNFGLLFIAGRAPFAVPFVAMMYVKPQKQC